MTRTDYDEASNYLRKLDTYEKLHMAMDDNRTLAITFVEATEEKQFHITDQNVISKIEKAVEEKIAQLEKEFKEL